MECVETKSGSETKSHPEMVGRCVADMTDEERREFLLSLPDDSVLKNVILEGIKTGEIKRCPKTDWCRVTRGKKEVEEKQKAERLITLEAREKIWEEDAKKKEQEFAQHSQEFAEYKTLTEARFDKISNFLLSLSK